uniref:RNase H type-1 domain-containing protein n=1 Tax=Cajanus cajan TaxID=3821 RepID=A0A151TSE5_CAJCA|nr:hypothetical protein KK1_009165 [Cajanus cajan]
MEEFNILKRLMVHFHLLKPTLIKQDNWYPLARGFIKCNMDGGAEGSLGHATCGGLFRDSSKTFLGEFVSYIGIKTALHAKLIIIMRVIGHKHDAGWRKLWLECDSKLVLNAFGNTQIVPWDICGRWRHCLPLCSHMYFLHSHIYREGNQCANKLVGFGLKHKILYKW